MSKRSTIAILFIVASWVAILVASVQTIGASQLFAKERLFINAFLLLTSFIATNEYRRSQRSLVESRSAASHLAAATDWTELHLSWASTWAARAVQRARVLGATESLPVPSAVVSPIRADAELEVVVLRWFATGSVLVGLAGTLYGLGHSIQAALDLLKHAGEPGAQPIDQGMAGALEPLSFCFWSSLLAVGVSLSLNFARLIHEAEIDQHMTELEDLLASGMSGHLFREWQHPVVRLEATTRALAGSLSHLNSISDAIRQAGIDSARAVTQEVRRELAPIPATLANAAKEGLRLAGEDTLKVLTAEDEPRRKQVAELATQLKEAAKSLRAMETTIRADHDHLLKTATQFDSMQTAVAKNLAVQLQEHVRQIAELLEADREAHSKLATDQSKAILAAHRADANQIAKAAKTESEKIGAALAVAAKLLGATVDQQQAAIAENKAIAKTTAASLTGTAAAVAKSMHEAQNAGEAVASSAAEAVRLARQAQVAANDAAKKAHAEQGKLGAMLGEMAKRVEELSRLEIRYARDFARLAETSTAQIAAGSAGAKAETGGTTMVISDPEAEEAR